MVTTDRGRQFDSSLFTSLNTLLGVAHFRTTAYHPQANGKVERWHRSLKSALKCHNSEDWVTSLPTILLGLRNVLLDSGFSASQLLFGSSLRLPGEFLTPDPASGNESTIDLFVQQLRDRLRLMRPVLRNLRSSQQTFVHPELSKTSHVFVRVDAVRRPLQQPYDGPFRVVKRGDKTFILDRNGKEDVVSIDRLKPAFLLNEDAAYLPIAGCPTNSSSSPSGQPPSTAPATVPDHQTLPMSTRRGRVIQLPVRFRL
uniref:Integrase catalytic domain-containing protein n=1 Tax=Lygus hesperus TaxID=30085 RepID=A0A0A9W8E2_LYGHE